ncbi:hypothetical protein TELCIR_15010 [Teladorsagia circumcincta]|uniref:Uncharacterized protein n=1 Tax=Teladorsagia circumcincta TaxID=45464 RepID=A0A2G9U105_TELCI|nr:hypothetical protein TELCIR_15010 [Teladorsagia circumcincta]
MKNEGKKFSEIHVPLYANFVKIAQPESITTLVNFKESYLLNGRPKSERAIRAALKVGSAVEAAIERFVAVGETIADENPDIQPEMYDACHEARLAGASIANLSCCSTDVPDAPLLDKSVLVRASRQLLSSVTRVLLLADRVLVKHILRAEDKVNDLSRLAKESDSAACGRVAAEKQAYMSLPRPGEFSDWNISEVSRSFTYRIPFKYNRLEN